MAEHTNRLIRETSPYLRQHARNPVDWYPWGDEALVRARREDKPILLSVGYSACHWCHVMERESFEDPETAGLMNAHFINVKVDREERPDIDQIYMNAVQLLTGRGGWPMTVFLTPGGEPFYAGTYFPPEDRYGMPGFRRVLLGVARAYREQPEQVRRTVEQLMAGLRGLERAAAGDAAPDAALVEQAAAALARAYDAAHGGIGEAPKFPNEAVFELFLRAHRHGGAPHYLEMTLHTLRQMARGGIYDQLGGGFHRYSVDAQWLVPHFEKMLYDNAQLVPLYLAAYQLTGDHAFADVAADVLRYVSRELRDPAGGFYASQDADSEGEEGKFFLWDQVEVRAALGDELARLACRYWDVTDVGNFERRNILHATLEMEQLAKLFGGDVTAVRARIAEARARLLAVRERRVRPNLDTKILTSWNALMISAYAKAGEVLDDETWLQTALEAAAFVETHLARGDRLLGVYADGSAKLNGYLDDYVFFVAALLDLFEATQDRRHLERAVGLTDAVVAHFWDAGSAGFYFTSDDHEALIVRTKPAFDGSLPSGNSVAVRNLLRLHHYTERLDFLERAEATLRLFAGAMREQPFGFANMLCALDFYCQQPREIVVIGTAAAAAPLLRHIRRTYLPNRTLTVAAPGQDTALPSLVRGKGQVGGRPTVYVCHRMTCASPVTEWAELEPLLRTP